MNGLVVTILLWIAAAICAGSLAMTLGNLRLYRRPAPAATRSASATQEGGPSVSVCIPARNEAPNIEACVRSALTGNVRSMEVLVYDDQSDDGTAEILSRLVAEDDRIRGVEMALLPAGWNGKQFGCDRLGRAARGVWLLFTDADVRFAPGAIDVSVSEAERMEVDLLSTFPRQETASIGESLLVPMIHFVLFSYLPMIRMRRTGDPAASAGCGQFLLCRRSSWERVGGHASWRESMHDGIRMPRAFRRAGFRTDLFDGTALVRCRMYHGSASAWRGFTKNAFEGLGSISMLLFLTVIHLIGHVAPWVVLALALGGSVPSTATTLAAIAAGLALTQRSILAVRFGQRWLGVVLHPVAVLLMLAVQWRSLWIHLTGRRTWRGRVAGAAAS